MHASPRDALRSLLATDVARQTLRKLGEGQGVDTPDGMAWLAAKAVADAPADPDGEITWPSTNDTARLEDMSPNGHLRVSLDESGDVIVEVFDGENFTSVEFCSGAGGGGKSRRVRRQLIALMVAIEQDNLDDVTGSRRHPRYGEIYS